MNEINPFLLSLIGGLWAQQRQWLRQEKRTRREGIGWMNEAKERERRWNEICLICLVSGVRPNQSKSTNEWNEAWGPGAKRAAKGHQRSKSINQIKIILICWVDLWSSCLLSSSLLHSLGQPARLLSLKEENNFINSSLQSQMDWMKGRIVKLMEGINGCCPFLLLLLWVMAGGPLAQPNFFPEAFHSSFNSWSLLVNWWSEEKKK